MERHASLLAFCDEMAFLRRERETEASTVYENSYIEPFFKSLRISRNIVRESTLSRMIPSQA